MQIGIVGLGRMGMNMALRLIQGGHDVCCYNRTVEKAHQLAAKGARAADTPAELVAMLDAPRIVWLMLPSGAATREHIVLFAKLLGVFLKRPENYYQTNRTDTEIMHD